MTSFSFAPIGYLSTPFKEKFGVPRQSLLLSEATGVLKLERRADFAQAVTDLETFSHIWLVFVFHKAGAWHPLIDTPRVDHGKKVGAFATRSPNRPNSIGMSAVELVRIDRDTDGHIELHLRGVDILDGTPVLDIKPYLPYADRIDSASAGWAVAEIERYAVEFSPVAARTLDAAVREHPRVRALVEQMLSLDPRPTSQRRAAPIHAAATAAMRFAFRVYDLDVRWQVRDGRMYVYDVVRPISD